MSNVLEVKKKYFNLIVVHNPLEPLSSRKVADLVWDNNKTLYDYLYDIPQDIDWVITYNAEPVTLEDSKNIKPEPDSYLVLIPNMLGGGTNSSGKQTFRMVAMLAIVVVAAAVGAYFAVGALGAGASTGAVMSAAASGAWAGAGTGAMIAGVYGATSSLIWNRPDIGDKRAEQFESTYGVDGAKMTANEGIPVGLCYGEYRIAGNCIQLRTENVGNTQDLYILQSLSEGEIESIENILINEQPISQFSNIEIEKRYGVDNQELIPWFDDTYASEYKGIDLTPEWTYMRTKNKMDKFSIDFLCPYGLYYSYTSTSSGRSHSVGNSVDVQIQYKPIDASDNEWRALNSKIVGSITNLTDIKDGDQIIFVDETGFKRIYAFHNIIYKDFDPIYDEETNALIGAYLYVPIVQYETEQNINTFFEYTKKQYVVDDKTLLGLEFICKYEKYNSGLFNIYFDISGHTYDYYVWDIQLVGETLGETKSFVAQNGENFTISGYSKNPIRKTITSNQIPLNYYDIRIRRTDEESPTESSYGKYNYVTFDKVTWVNTNAIILDDITYNYTALLGTKVRLDGQLNSTPNITADVKGIKCNHYNYSGELTETKWTDNPAWIAIDLLTNGRYGGAIDISRIDIPKFIEWADYCTEQEISFNGYFGSESNLWDILKSVLMVGHASLVISGTKITLSIDMPRQEVFLFNNSNIIKGSLSTSWSGLQDRANTIELTYFDKDDNYNQKTIKIVDSESLSSQRELKEYRTTVVGITNEKQATRECKRLSLLNKYLQQTVTFSAPIEAVGCSIGDVIIVQHDVPQWGYGGKLAAGSTLEHINLDRPVTMQDNREYMILIHHDAVCRYTANIESIVGKSIFINKAITERVRRLKSGGLDLEITKIIPGSPLTEIIVSNAQNLTVGGEIELWDTDVLEEANVVTDAFKELTEVVLQNPLKYQPQQFSNWLFGYKDAYRKKFAVTAMSGLNTETITITGREYSDSFYDYDNYEGNDPIISDIATKIQPVYNLTATEEVVKNGSAFYTDVIINWDTATLNTYFGADIYVRRDSNLPFEKVTEVKDGVSTYRVENLNDGDTIEVKVVAFDGAGRRADFNASPIIKHTVLGKDKKPDTPANFEIRKTSQGLMLAWDIVREADVVGYIIKQGTEWISGTVIDDNVSNNRYTIQYTEAGTKSFMVKAKDAFGNESEKPAIASIVLEPPLDPIDFMSVQNNDFIVLKWNNLDPSVSKFRIKEGESWGSGTIVADVAGYSHSVPINGYYNRKFWLKSIDEFGVFSANAVYTSPMAIEHQTKNVIVEYDESGNGFPHPSINMELVNDYLVINEGAKYGEYNWYVDIGEKLYSRIISEDQVDAIQYSPKWKDFKNRWNSFEAQSPWAVKASLDNVQIERQMALPAPIPEDVIESFSYYLTADGERGTKPIEEQVYKYENGRFREGIVVDDSGSLGYNINIPEIFSVKFWVRPKKLISAGYIEFVNEEGDFLHLFYRESESSFVLQDNLENTLSVKSEFNKDEPILMCVSQSESERTLMIGFSKDLKILKDTKPLMPLGAFTIMNLK